MYTEVHAMSVLAEVRIVKAFVLRTAEIRNVFLFFYMSFNDFVTLSASKCIDNIMTLICV